MAFKPNYNQQRAERDRAKQARKDEKLREQDAARARRRAGEPEPDGETATPAPDEDPKS